MERNHQMKLGYRVLLTGLVILTISGLSGYKATLLLDELFHYRSPLQLTPPSTGEAFQPALTEKVVIVLIDGLRVDTAANSSLMPELERLRNLGASATMISHPPSYSEPGYSTILTGAWPDINDGPVFNLEYGEIPLISQETIFSTSKAANLTTAISAYYWFEELVPQEQVDQSFYTPGEDNEADRAVVNAALPWLIDSSINLLIIHIDQIDYAGHYEGGGVSVGWDEAATRSDQLLAKLAANINLSSTTLLVFSDHGHIDAGGHGGDDEITLKEPFVAAGLGIIPGQYDDIQMVDLAPTIAILLGTSLPSSSEGKPLVDMLTLTQEQLHTIDFLHDIQQNKLIETYASALGMKDLSQIKSMTNAQSAITFIQSGYLSDGRLFRSILAGLFLGAVIYGCSRKRPYVLPALVGTALFVLSFHTFYALIPERSYSFSIISTPESFILDAITWTIVAFLIAVIPAAYMIKIWRVYPETIIWICLGFSMIILLTAAGPALWYFIIYGPTIQKVLPDIGLLFRAMLSLLEAMTVGVTGLLITGFTWLLMAILSGHKP
jgi:hypothetical protein